MKKIAIYILLFCIVFPISLFAKDGIGEITWIDGTADVYRDGEALDWWDVDIGLGINDYDLIETGKDSYVEIEVLTPGNQGTVVKISENTAFYFDLKEVGGATKTTFQLLAGSLAMKVGKLTGSNAVEVNTESAVMGVRGTEFDVFIGPEGSVLVTCEEGKVQVSQNDNKSSKMAQPGAVVRKDFGSDIRDLKIDTEDLELYKAFWVKERDEVFKSGAKDFIKYYSAQYEKVLPKFLFAYEKLKGVKDTLIKYGSMQNASLGQMVLAKEEVSGPIFEMRSVFPFFEHVFYSVQTLEGYHDMGLGMGMISDSLSSTAFFSEFTGSKKLRKNQLAEVRRYFKLYLAIDRASGGGMSSDLMEGIFQGGNPLDGGGIPSGNVPKSGFNKF